MINTSIAHQRLTNQGINPRRCNTSEAVVRWMGAMQAQDYAQALWAVGARLNAEPSGTTVTAADVERAITDGSIIRTWPMRGTLHFVAPEDALWMVKLCASRMIGKDARRQQQLELNTGVLERCAEIFSEALHSGRHLTRSRMLAALESAGISTKNQRGYHILWWCAQIGLLCLGPMQDKEQTFVLLTEWIARANRVSAILTGDEALGALARRYFTSHGPATVEDFTWWSGLKISDCRLGIEIAKANLVGETIEQKVYWRSADALDMSNPDRSGLVLLPGYDEYLLGYAGRGAILDPQFAGKVCPGGNGVFAPMIVVNGQIVGTWKRTIKKTARRNDMIIAPDPFIALTDDEVAAFEIAATRFAAFWGLSYSA